MAMKLLIIPAAALLLLAGSAEDKPSRGFVRAVSKAESLHGVPSARELGTVPARIR